MRTSRELGGEVSLHIDAPVAAVWALVSDVTRIGEFSPETFEARWTRGATGPAVGATFKGHVKRNGVGPVYWSGCTVTRCEPEREFEFVVGAADRKVIHWGYRLRPDADLEVGGDSGGGGTTVTEYYRLEPSLPVRAYWMAFGPLRRRTNDQGMRTTLERMRTVLER